MPSFLEQINNRAKETPVEEETNEKVEAEEPEKAEKPKLSGIRSTEHETEIDRGFLKKRITTILVVALTVCAIIAAVWITIYNLRLVKVEDFTDRTFAEMQKWASECNIVLDEKDVFDEEISEGTVMEQSVKGGKKAAPRSVINVTVSKGADPDKHIEVPELTAMTAADVKDWISSNKLAAAVISEENSDTVEKGRIIRYEFGDVSITEDNFRRGDTLTVYASKGKAVSKTISKMPDLTGKAQADAEAWASEKKVSVSFTEVISDTAAKGKIVSQSIAKDTAIDAGASVVFEVSAGPGITVPNYYNYTREDADNAEPEIILTKKSVYSTSVGFGGLISQSIRAGTKLLAPNNKVELVYSLGAPFMPQLVGKSENELPELFYNFNSQGTDFNYSVSYVDSSEPKGTIVWASKGSEYVSLKEHISISVSLGNLSPETEPAPEF